MEHLSQKTATCLGDEFTTQEFDRALQYATDKLERIIAREGDADGARGLPEYLAHLIAEHILFSRMTTAINERTAK